MGKKTKKKGSSSSSAAASKAEKDLKRVARRSLIDKHGRMPREDGIRFYALLDFVALIVIDDVENERRFRNREYWTPLNWPERDGLQKMPNAARTIVLNYIWQNIHRITDEIDAGRHDELFLTKVGRRIEEKDKSEIRSWRNHIKDDFIVIDHLPHKGSVFVQVGRVAKFEQPIERQPIKDDSDIHDPRVFLIQGLATPLKELCEGSHEELTRKFPSLKKKYDLPISIIHATIIPYNKGVTIGVTAEQQNCHYYETPQQYAEAVNIAHDCYELTVLKNNQETTTSNSSPCCKLYHTITRDIVRQAKPSFNVRMMHEKLLREEVQVSPDDHKNDPEMTRLVVHGIIWMPFQNTDFAIDPRTVDVIKEVTLSERPLKVVREGFKHRIKWELWCNDHHPCPFHRHIGGKGTTLSFAKCCKEDHLKRVAKAKKRREDLISSYWYNPVEEEEADCISRDPIARQKIIDTLRIGPHDCSDVRLRVPLSHVDEAKWRMDNAQIFLPIIDTGVELKWIYVGWIPVAVGHTGPLSFGEITLNTETGDFVATAMTADRCAGLITRLKFLCSYGDEVGKGIPIEDMSLIGTQMGKSKPDKAALSRNAELLEEDLDIKASMAFNKVSSSFLRCDYYGKVEDDQGDFRLLQCACKQYHYCNKEHQRLNWKDHRETCYKIREGS